MMHASEQKRIKTRLAETSRTIRDYMITISRLSVSSPMYQRDVYQGKRCTVPRKGSSHGNHPSYERTSKQHTGEIHLNLKASCRSNPFISHQASHRRKPSCIFRGELSTETASAERSRPCVILTKGHFASGQLPRLAPICS